MPNNNDFIAKAKSQGYTDEQIRQYQILKQSGQLPVKMPVVNNTISQVDTDAALHSQGILQDFVGSGWNAAVDMVKSVPMIAKAVNDTTAQSDSFSDAMKVTSDAIDKHLKYTIAPDYNKGIVELNEDGSMSLTNFRSLFNGIGNGVGQVGLAMATGGNNVYGRLAANTLMNFPSVYESAEKAGLNKKDAARFSLLLSPILGATEEIGGVQPYLAKNLFGKVAAVETKQIISKLRNEAISETLEKAAKGELTEEAFGKLAKETSTKYLAKIKELAPETLKEMAGEGGQEMFQDAIQQGAEQIYDKFFAGNAKVGKGKFGTELISTDPNNQLGGLNIGGYGITKKGFVSLANNGILGGLIGGSAHIAIHQNPEFLQQTLFGFIDDNVKNGQGESAMKRINALVNLNVQQQKITPQDGEIMLKKAQQIYDIADRWKNVEHEGMTNSERYKAYDLTSNVLPMLDAPIKQFEDTFGASDLPGALANIDTNDKIDDFQKGAMKQSAVDTFGDYYKAIQKRDVIKSYLQQLGNSGKATDLNAQIKAIDALSVNDIFNKVGMESVAPKNAVTKAIHDELNIENDLLPNNTIEQNGEVNQEDDSLRENKSGLEKGSQVRGGQSKGQESGLESSQENAIVESRPAEQPSSQANTPSSDEKKIDYFPREEFDYSNIGSESYKNADHKIGRSITKTIPDGTKLKGSYKIVSADDVLASHNETTFAKTKGFPVNKQGKTVNDRDYERDKGAQSEVVRIAQSLDDRAISQTPVVTKEGIVIDGNNRTMSRKLAAKNGTDKGYLSALKESADLYGFTESDIDSVKNPMLVFQPDEDLPYTTTTFSRFNKADKKEKSPIERAVEISKTMSKHARNVLSSMYAEAETPSDVTSNARKVAQIKALLQQEGILMPNEMQRYFSNETGLATKEGVSFLDTLLLGGALNESTIRALENPSMGQIRNTIMTSVIALTKNATLGKNSLLNNIQNGIHLINRAKQSKLSVIDTVAQLDMFEQSKYSSEDLAIAVLLDGSGFRTFIEKYNSEVGTLSMFGGLNTKENLVDELLKAKISNYEQIRHNLRPNEQGGEEHLLEIDEFDGRQGETEEDENNLNGIGLSLENQPGVGQGENNGSSEADKSGSERKIDAENNGQGNQNETGENRTSETTGSQKPIQQNNNGSNKPNTENINDGEVQNDRGNGSQQEKPETEGNTDSKRNEKAAEKSKAEKLDDEISGLWDDLASAIGAIKKFDGNGGPDAKALEIGIKLVTAYTKKGIYQLSDMAKDMAEKFGDAANNLLPYLKDAYNSVRGRSDREDRKKFNTEDEVFDYELKPEQDGTNDTAGVRQLPKQSTERNGGNWGNMDRAPKGKQEDLFSSTSESGRIENESNTEAEYLPSGRGTIQNNESSRGRGRGISEGRTLFVADDKPENFTLPDNFGIKTFNPKVRFTENLDALKIVVALKNENRYATKEEQEKLSRYVGWGGLGVVLANQNTVWTQADEQLRPLVVELDGVISELEKAGFKDVKKHIKASVSTSHYTPIPVIKSMYSALTQLGFKHGNILDPSAGIGHFFGAMPTSIKNNSSLTSVEIEPLTAFIHKSLYPNSAGYNTGYEDANLPDGSYDLVVSNVPFGQLAVYDKKFNTPELKSIQGKIHNYFFAKAIQQAKEGGLIAFITSSGTLNSRENENIRKYISKNAEFIGAIRLPSSTFQGNAGTQVVSDVIFLKKNSKGNAGGIDFNTLVEIEVPHKSTGAETKIDVNKYFVDNPGNVIGEFKAGGQYRADEMTVIQKDGTDIAAEMQKAIEKTFPKNIYSKVDTFSQKNTLVEIQESKDIHENELYIGKDGLPYKSNGEGIEPTTISKKYTPKLVAQFIALRDSLKRQYELESDTRASENDIENNRHFLNKYYEDFVSKFGNLHKSSGLILKDVNGFNVLSLETKDDNSKTYRKADILSKRVIKVVTRPTTAENINDAINISLDESGFIDENRVASLLGQSVESVISSHYGELFYDSDGKVVDRATYLSGNVKKKLAEAIELSKTNTLYEKNVEELEKVQPEDIPASSIDVNIGARWVPVDIYKKFVSEILNSNVDVIYSKAKDEYTVSGNETVESKEKYGTSRISAYRLIELAMAGQSPVIRDKVSSDPDKYVVNKDETQKAQEKQEQVVELFGDWIWKDSSRRDSLGALYNAKFNTTVKKKYNGSYLHFDGMSDGVKLAQHQLDGASMLIANKGGIIDHIVGAGKTYLMIASAIKMKRMGIVNKPVIAGLKSTIPHLISDAKKLYPGAKILSPSQTDFNAKNRKAFLSKIQNNDWDLIIMSHEQFGSIPQDTEMQIDVMNEEIEMLDMEIALLEAESGKSASKKVLKGLEARKNTLTSKLKELMDAPKDIEILNFKQIGIDKIFIDESQMFKNLEYSTRINRVAGLGNPKGSKRALNLLTAIRTLQKHHGGDMGATFLSGTPISNSLVEMYLLFKYLRPNKMNELGYKTFDSWVKQFAVASNALEFAVTGSVKQNTRFRSFINIPELSMLYSEITDLRNDDNLVLDKPKIKGGEPKLVLIKQSEYQKEWTQRLIEFAKQTHGDRDGTLIGKGELTESEQTAAMLMVTGISNKLSIDMRLIDKNAEDNPTGKLSAVAQKVYDDYVETDAIKGTQLIFCDTGTPKTKNTVENLKGYMEDELNIQLDDINSIFGEEGTALPPIATVKERLSSVLEWEPEYIETVINESKNAEGQFNVYDELKRKLIEKGIPENQVVFIHSYNTAKAKESLFDAVNNGDIRVVIGSTQKLGTGVNCQRRIVSLHHIDAQWNPAAMEQRNGRGIRQKNMNAEVGIYYYGTELTLDAYKYQLIATKQKFINQVKSGTLSEGERSVREDDGEDMGMDSMVAILSGNPLLFEKAKTDNIVDKMKRSRKNFFAEIYNAESKIDSITASIPNIQDELERRKSDYEKVASFGYNEEGTRIKTVAEIVGGKPYETIKELGEQIISQKNQILQRPVGHTQVIGTVNGMKLQGTLVKAMDTSGLFQNSLSVELKLVGELAYSITSSSDPTSQGVAIGNALNKLQDGVRSTSERLNISKVNLIKYKELSKKTWDKQSEYDALIEKQKKINDELKAQEKAENGTQDNESEDGAQFATGPQTQSTTTEKEQSQKIIDFFQQGMKLDVFAPASEYESALAQATKGKALLSDTGQPIGFVLNGRIHLNPKTLNPETTFHELIHVQQQLIKEAAKKGDAQAEMILKRFNVLLSDTVSKIIDGNRNVVIDGVKVDLSSSVYNQTEGETDLQYRERLRDELWSYIQAPVNEKKWNEGISGIVSRFIDAVKKFFKEKLGLKDASNLQSMTLAELVDASAVSLMKGEYFENVDTVFQGVETPVKADPNKVYRVASNADTAIGKDVSFSSGLNWYEGQGFIIEANKGKGEDIVHHSGAKRGEISPSDVTTVYYEPNGFATDSETVYSELPKMRKQFPNAQFIQIKYGETPQGKADLKSVGMESRAKSGQPLFAIAPTTTPLIEDIKQTPELSATKETIPTMSFPLELVKIKNMIGSGVKKLGDTVPPSVAVSDYLTKYINKILEYKAYNADGTEKRYAFVGKLEDLRSSLGKASTVPLLNNIYDNIINKEPLTKEASGFLNALTEYHIQYNRVQQTNDAIVIDSDTIYNRDEVKDMAIDELTKGKEAVRIKMLENSKYGKPIAAFLEKYTLAVSSLPTWAKILAGGENSMLYKLVKALDSAQDKQYVMAETARSYLSQIQDKISTGSTFNTNDITKSAKEEVGKHFEKYSGIKTKISEGELLHIYLTLKNDQVRARFFKNGYSGVFELKEYRDKNDKVLREHLSIDMTEADYSKLESKFSAPEWSSKIKAWTDANEFLYKYVDQTHREDTGVSLRKAEGFYYPLIHGNGISSYEDYLKQNKFVDDLRSAKARSPQVHANYLVVDALQLMNNYVDANTKYASYATPLKNIDVYLKNSDEFFRKNDMMKYVEWYNKFKKEFEDPSPDKMGEIGKRLMSRFVISRLGLNPLVTLKQYSSIFVSNNVIPSKYIVSSLDELAKNAGGVIKSFIPGKTIPFDKTMNEMLEHSATARRRLNVGQNYFDELVKSGIKDYETVVFGKNIKVPFSKMTNNIAAADRAVSALYWVAAKKQVSAETNYSTGSREYWNAVNDIYSKAVIESQSSMDDVNRPHMTKDANILVKGLTLFSGQSFSNFNSFIGNVIEHANNPSKDNKMKVARSIMNIYVYNALMVAAVDSLKYAQNGDDEDKLKKKAFRSLISNSYQNIPIVAPIVDEIWSKVENPRFAREINYPVLQVINDGASLIGNLSNEKFDKAVTDGIKFGAEGIGLPAYPIESVQKIYAK